MIKNLTFLSVLLFCANHLQAAVIRNVTIHSVSSEFTSGATDQRRATNIVSGQGLFGHSHSADPKGTMWLTSPTTVDGLTNAFVTFDLGAVYNIHQMKVWNYNEAASGANVLTRRGVKEANISVAGEDLVFTTNIANQTFTRATGTFSSTHDTVDMGGIAARYVRINVLTNYFEAGDYRVGLSEVQFIDNSVQPEALSATHNFLRNRVTVHFSEPVLLSTATNLANYTIQSGAVNATVVSAKLNQFNDSVILETSTLDSNLVYTVSIQNVRDAADAISIANTQLNIESELVLWLKADADVTAEGGFVTQWNDQSGFGNHAVAVSQPVLVDGAVNGKPAIHFDGSTQAMEVPHHPSLVADRDITVYSVVSIDALAGGKSVISKCNNNVPASFDCQIVASTGKPSFVRGNGSGFTTFNQSVAPLAANEFYITAVVMDATNATHYLNGNFNGSGFIGAPVGDTGNPIRIGIRQDGHAAARLVGNLAEVLVLRGAASEADLTAINEYLGTKYGIDVVTLEITSAPDNATRTVGQTATFGVTAKAGSPTIFYQWQKGTTNIPGATNSSYTTPPLTLSDDGTTYRVVVSTPLGVSVNSSSALLTVSPDTHAPTVHSATRTANAAEILVKFSEPVEEASATNIANYSLNLSANIVSAVRTSPNTVVLTTLGLNDTANYVLSVQNVTDSFSNGMSQTQAGILPADPVFWIRADSGVTINDSGFVNQVDDQTVYNNHASQYLETARKPLLVPGAMNGNPVLRFDGLDDFLEAASSPSLVITGDITIYAVANFDDFGLAREIVSKTAVNQPASFDFYVQHNPLQTRLYRGNGLGANGVFAGAAPSPGVPHVLSVVQEGTTVSHFLEGAPNGVGTVSTTLGDTGAPLRVGSRNDLFQFMKGEIAEILIFNRALSAEERKTVDNYLGFKYFPLDFSEQPASTNVLEGQTATFRVVASAGAATFEYQWQKNSQDIPGATNATYTTPILTLADNMATYRVVITLPNGSSVNSDPAQVFVSPDQELPTVLNGGKVIWNGNQIVVTFSEAVNPSTATNISSYALDNGATITGIVMGNSPNEVILTVSGLNEGTPFTLTVQNVSDLFGNVMSVAFIPVGHYPMNLSLWLSADSEVTLGGGDSVASWGDLSGNANHAFEVLPGTAPILVPNAINGLPAIRFDGTNQFLAIQSSPSVAIVGDMTLFVVAKFKDFVSTSNEVGMVGKSLQNQAAPYDFYLLKTSGLPRFYRGNGTAGASITGTTAPSLDSAHNLAVRTTGTAAEIFMDGALNGSGTINVEVADAGTLLGVGTRDDLRPKMNGDIAEILLFSSSLTDLEKAEIDNYLAAKYGIVSEPVALSIQSSNGNFVISWPVTPVPLVLESKANLSAALWEVVTNSVETVEGVNRVIVTPNANESYYRLRD